MISKKHQLKRIIKEVISELMGSDNLPSNRKNNDELYNQSNVPVDSMTSNERNKFKRDKEKLKHDTIKDAEKELQVSKSELDYKKKSVDQEKRFKIPDLTKKIQSLKSEKSGIMEENGNFVATKWEDIPNGTEVTVKRIGDTIYRGNNIKIIKTGYTKYQYDGAKGVTNGVLRITSNGKIDPRYEFLIFKNTDLKEFNLKKAAAGVALGASLLGGIHGLSSRHSDKNGSEYKPKSISTSDTGEYKASDALKKLSPLKAKEHEKRVRQLKLQQNDEKSKHDRLSKQNQDNLSNLDNSDKNTFISHADDF